MSRKNKALFLLVLICVMISLLTALIPLSDFEHDGSIDSLITDGFLLAPLGFILIRLASLLIQLPAPWFTNPQHVSFLIVPPPISTK